MDLKFHQMMILQPYLIFRWRGKNNWQCHIAMVTYPIFVEKWVGDEEMGGLESVEIASNGKSNFIAKMGGFIYDNGTNFQSEWNNSNFWWT